MHEAADTILSQQGKTPSRKQRSVLKIHIPCVLEVSTGYYSMQPEGGKYTNLVAKLKREPDIEKRAQLGRHLLVHVRSHIKHQIY